jgi:DNA mismatch endonuclease (patch repair protein)
VTDVFSKRKRSAIMSRIRSAGTKPELVLRASFRALGVSYRCNVMALPGSPDLVVRSLRAAVFVDGCYWHGCPRHFRLPSSNVEFWREKIRRNKARDARTRRELRRLGWSVWTYWEHELKDLVRFRRNLRRRVTRALAST